MEPIKIYTDGSCNTVNGDGGWAFYIPELNIRVGNKVLNTSNNRMELLAVIKALECIQDLPYNTFIILSDSSYVIEGHSGKWKITTNKDLWSEFNFQLTLVSDKNISLQHVKGHDGNEGNEIVDKLAVLVRNLYISNE